MKKMDILGKSDPFVRIYLMPGNHKELKTKVIKKNLNPLFNEVFKFVVSDGTDIPTDLETNNYSSLRFL